MEKIVLTTEWVHAIALLPEPQSFLTSLAEYRVTRCKNFRTPTETAMFTAIQSEFDKLNFPLDNGNRCACASRFVPTGNV
jgi:hypothetical protein